MKATALRRTHGRRRNPFVRANAELSGSAGTWMRVRVGHEQLRRRRRTRYLRRHRPRQLRRVQSGRGRQAVHAGDRRRDGGEPLRPIGDEDRVDVHRDLAGDHVRVRRCSVAAGPTGRAVGTRLPRLALRPGGSLHSGSSVGATCAGGPLRTLLSLRPLRAGGALRTDRSGGARTAACAGGTALATQSCDQCRRHVLADDRVVGDVPGGDRPRLDGVSGTLTVTAASRCGDRKRAWPQRGLRQGRTISFFLLGNSDG